MLEVIQRSIDVMTVLSFMLLSGLAFIGGAYLIEQLMKGEEYWRKYGGRR